MPETPLTQPDATNQEISLSEDTTPESRAVAVSDRPVNAGNRNFRHAAQPALDHALRMSEVPTQTYLPQTQTPRGCRAPAEKTPASPLRHQVTEILNCRPPPCRGALPQTLPRTAA